MKYLDIAMSMATMTKDLFIEKNRYTYKRDCKKIGRNDLCNCGSGKKYKKCCALTK